MSEHSFLTAHVQHAPRDGSGSQVPCTPSGTNAAPPTVSSAWRMWPRLVAPIPTPIGSYMAVEVSSFYSLVRRHTFTVQRRQRRTAGIVLSCVHGMVHKSEHTNPDVFAHACTPVPVVRCARELLCQASSASEPRVVEAEHARVRLHHMLCDVSAADPQAGEGGDAGERDVHLTIVEGVVEHQLRAGE